MGNGSLAPPPSGPPFSLHCTRPGCHQSSSPTQAERRGRFFRPRGRQNRSAPIPLVRGCQLRLVGERSVLLVLLEQQLLVVIVVLEVFEPRGHPLGDAHTGQALAERPTDGDRLAL